MRLGQFIWENKRKCKNWDNLTPPSSEIVRRAENSSKMGTSVALGLSFHNPLWAT